MVPRVGQRIGPYEILGRLGSGGMGLVFSAWDARLQRDVAIKLLREEYATPTMRSRFLQEARAASGLNHPNICTIFDIGDVSGDPFLVMELLKGETLRSRISGRGRLPPDDVRRIAAEVLDALGTAHTRGIIHRDIKPANIILVNRPGGGFQTKVLDFGLAKVEFGDEESTRFDLTTIGTTVGTVSYMSPEQARGETIDARSDLFSLGSVLYEAVTGELPFQGATSALIFVELLGKNPEPVRQQNPAVPKDLDRFITRLLAKDRADRFQSAANALESLREAPPRKSPLGGISLWGKGSPRPKAEPPVPPAVPETPNIEPAPGQRSPDLQDTSPLGKNSGETVLRPARRVPDPLAPRAAGPVGSLLDRGPASPDISPIAHIAGGHAAPPAPAPSAGWGEVVVRPIKPDTLRSALAPETAAGSTSDVPKNTDASTGMNADSSGGRAPVPAHAPLESPVALDQFVEELSPAPLALDSAVPQLSGGAQQPWGTPAAAEDVIANPAIPSQRDSVKAVMGARPWIWVAAVAALAVIAGTVWYFGFQHDAHDKAGTTVIAFSAFGNDTGDSSLSGVMTAGLELAAAQSPRLSIRPDQDDRFNHPVGQSVRNDVSSETSRGAARAAGAGVLVSGTIHSAGAAYDLSVQLIETASGKRIAEMSETASSREQIAQALDRLASDLRSALGESSDSIGRAAVPLAKEATSNLEALALFASGAELEAAGNANEAILSYQRAVGAEPHFTQAYLRLADLYREQHAEVGAAHAATQAQAGAANASTRTQTLAQVSYALNAQGDYGRAADSLQQLLQTCPDDLVLLDQLALAQLLGGKFADAQRIAEHILELSRFDRSAIQTEELALIAQGRSDAVSAVQAQAVGRINPDLAALAAAATPPGDVLLLPDADRPLSPAVAADLFDAAGHFSEGAARWEVLADIGRAAPEQISAAAYARATSALHHALAADCDAALSLARQAQALPSGAEATFRAGEAEALCGSMEDAHRSLATLTTAYGQGSAAQAYLAPDLAATLAWKAGDAAGALNTLDAARRFDLMSLTAYLRGLVEISAHQPQLSIVQFQTILSHRGPTTLFNAEVYPLAQLGLGRAYAAVGDKANSSIAYGRFLELWNTADPGIPALSEARSHAHL